MTACVLLTVASIEAACSLVAPVETVSQPGQAQRLAQAGRHAEAARAFAGLAATPGADKDYDQLQSAAEWLASGRVPEAKQALAAVSDDARSRLPVLRALVAGKVALADNDGARALREIDQIPVPTQAGEAADYWLIRGRSGFLTARPVDGVRAFVERERWLNDAAALRADRQELYDKIVAATERGNSLKASGKTDEVVAGWLALGPVGMQLARDPMRAAAALAAWRKRFPLHPANDSVLAAAQSQLVAATTFPNQIALLLPLSGRSEAVGVAVRDGFLAAYFEQDPASRPHLKVYDVAAHSAAAAYTQAVEEGASFVVGPLTKDDVAAVAPLAAGRSPVLALNFLADPLAGAGDLYQFALLPEDEARIVARRVVADGRLQGVAILPEGEWGNRVGAAFADELVHLGGALLDSQHYEASRTDFSDIIRAVMQVHAVKGEPSTHRTDAAFIFVAGAAPAARLIVPQLKFHYVQDVPLYSTSDSFEPGASNDDLDGLQFPDMPWMIATDAVTAQIRDAVRAAWPARTVRRDRLYAFGFDAYRLVPALRANSFAAGATISGMSGRLRLDEHNRIRRDLEWAEIRSGVPQPL